MAPISLNIKRHALCIMDGLVPLFSAGRGSAGDPCNARQAGHPAQDPRACGHDQRPRATREEGRGADHLRVSTLIAFCSYWVATHHRMTVNMHDRVRVREQLDTEVFIMNSHFTGTTLCVSSPSWRRCPRRSCTARASLASWRCTPLRSSTRSRPCPTRRSGSTKSITQRCGRGC